MFKTAHKSDFLGIVSSGLCMIHCLLFPVLFIYHGDHSHEQFAGFNLDYIFFGIAALAVYSTTKKQSPAPIKISLWVFLSLCFTGILFHDYSPVLKYILYLGSTGLIVTHLFNIRHCNHCC